jgi:hypothetical protein
MMIIAASQYRNAPRPCRSSTGHSAACSDRQFGPLRKQLLSTNAAPFGRNDLLSHSIGLDQYPLSTCRNSHTTSVPIKSP